jgi:hypothetical protein
MSESMVSDRTRLNGRRHPCSQPGRDLDGFFGTIATRAELVERKTGDVRDRSRSDSKT